MSIGVTAFDDDDVAPLSLIRRAVAALAEAKTNGKNRVQHHGQVSDRKE